MSERWVRKLLRRMKREGDRVVVHGLQGRASNRKIAAKTQGRALEVLQQPEWHDFGPTFAAEQLAQRHDINVSDETLRQWMIGAGVWKSRARKLDQVHCWRSRRSAFRELVQWDTSEHDWLEGRGPVRYLVRMIDDATSWSWGRFVERDATPFNMAVLWEYLEKNGRMVEVYTDRDSMFAVPLRPHESAPERIAQDRLTQLGRGLRELGIGWIAAFSPQAKGRIERSFLTAQDRLVKQLRLAKVATMEAANAFLEQEYWPEWNARFARPVAESPNQHRALTAPLDLAAILAMSRSASSPMTTHFLSPAAVFRLRAKMSRLECGGNACGLRSAWTASYTRGIKAVISTSAVAARAGPAKNPRRGNRRGEIIMPALRASGWTASSIVRHRLCGSRLPEIHLEDALLLCPKPRLGKFHPKQVSSRKAPLGDRLRPPRF